MNALIHVAGAANFGYALYYDLMFVHLPSHLRNKGSFAAMEAFPGKWKYLTVWNMVLQLVYHVIALLNDMSGTSEVNPKRQGKLQKLRDHYFASWAFPAGIFVSLTFWILFGIDRALVFPKEMDAFYPNWLNHAVHTGPILFLAVETASVAKIYPTRSVGITANMIFTSVYLGCFVWFALQFVSVVFWTVYAIDRELMFPAVLDSIFPVWLNHAVHTGPIVFALVEHLVVPLVYPKRFIGSILLIFGVSLYISWIVWVNHISGVWAYPVLEVMNNYQRAGFLAGCAVAILSFYFAGDLLNKWRWGSSESKTPSGKAGKSAKGKRKTK